MRNMKFSLMLVCALSLAALLNGCGSSSKEGASSPADVAKVSETACRVCHAATIDPVSTDSILQDYLASAHNLVPGARSHYPDGVGCQGCHGGGAQHNGVGPIPYSNPDAEGKCYSCHTGHFNAAHVATNSTDAQYVSKNFENSCTSCHDPHKADKGITQTHKDWAETGHAKVTSKAFTEYDFKNRNIAGVYSCGRCHTSTGFVHFLDDNYAQPFPKTTWATAGDASREVITCKACHTSFNYKNSVRKAGTYTAAYGVAGLQASVMYDDAATSNLCVPCHTGLLNEAAIEAVKDFTNTDFSAVSSHYFAAAATLYSKVGFKYYSDPVKYDPALDFNGTHFSHNQIGINDYKLPLTFAPFQATGFKGPCVSCHMQSGNHKLDIAPGYAAGGICTKCHLGPYAMTAAKIEEEKEGYNASLSLLEAVLSSKGMTYTTTYPYFATKNWTAVGPANGSGKQNMGAAFNFNFLKHEPGAFAHNRIYAKRIIYDSLEYLQKATVDGTINFSNFSSATVPVSKARTYLSKEGAPSGTRP